MLTQALLLRGDGGINATDGKGVGTSREEECFKIYQVNHGMLSLSCIFGRLVIFKVHGLTESLCSITVLKD